MAFPCEWDLGRAAWPSKSPRWPPDPFRCFLDSSFPEKIPKKSPSYFELRKYGFSVKPKTYRKHQLSLGIELIG